MSNIDKEFDLPQASVTRILKGKLPDGVSVSKEAKVAFSRSAGVFIVYLTNAANENCRQQKRQTLTARDIFEALRIIQFDEFMEPLEESLEELRGGNIRKKPRLSKNQETEEENEQDADPVTVDEADTPVEETTTAELTKEDDIASVDHEPIEESQNVVDTTNEE